MHSQKSPNKKFFSLLNQIDKRVAKIKKKAIIIVGLPKVGKSTAFNWINEHPLTARRQVIKRQSNIKEIDQKRRRANRQQKQYSQITYVAQDIITDAQIKPGFFSSTLLPNIVDFHMLGNDVSLIDMGGYGQSPERTYIEILGITYGYKAVLQAVEQVRFIIVIEEQMLSNYSNLHNTFNHFVKMFNFSKNGEQFKEAVFSATSLLITRSTKVYEHHILIDKCIDELHSPYASNIQNGLLIADLLDSIYQDYRFDCFKMPSLGYPPQKCEILQAIKMKHWNYMEFGKQSKILNFPFREDCLSLSKADHELFSHSIKQKRQCYYHFRRIFFDVFDEQLNQKDILDIKIDYSEFFGKITEFIQKHDYYDTDKEKILESQNIAIYLKPQKASLLKLVLQMMDIVTISEQDHRGPTSQIIGLYKDRIEKLLQIMIIVFCRNYDDYKMLIQAKYILVRGTREFYMLMESGQSYVCSVITNIRDQFFEKMFQVSKYKILSKIISSFPTRQNKIFFDYKNQRNMFQQYHTSRQSVYVFQYIFQRYYIQFAELQNKQKEIFLELLRDTKIIHAKYQYQMGNYQESIQYLLEAIKYQQLFEYSQQNIPQDSQKLNNFYMLSHRLNIFCMLKENLIKLNKFEVALMLSKKLLWVDSVSQIYELILKNTNLSDGQRFEIVQQYAMYCIQHGRGQKGISLLQKLLQPPSTLNYCERRKVINMIKKSIQDQQQYRQRYIIFLQQYANTQMSNDITKHICKEIRSSLHPIKTAKNIIQIVNNRFSNYQATTQQKIEQMLMMDFDGDIKVKRLSVDQTIQVYRNKKAICVESIHVLYEEQLDSLKQRLLEKLDHLSKASLSSHQQIFVEIYIDAVQLPQFEQTQEKHLAIFINKQRIQPNTEYVFKTLRKIKKLIKQPINKLRDLINQCQESIKRLEQQLRDQLLQNYCMEEHNIQAIIIRAFKASRLPNIGLERIYAEMHSEDKLLSCILFDLSKVIKERLKVLCNQYVEQKAKGISRAIWDQSTSMELSQ